MRVAVAPACRVGLAILILTAALAGCSSINDESSTDMFTATRKYDSYACPDIAIQMKTIGDREQELRAVMARAEQAPEGAFINNIAYRNEYLQTRANLKLLREAAAKKNCSNLTPR